MARTKKQQFPDELRVSLSGEPGEAQWFEARDNKIRIHENHHNDGDMIAIYELKQILRVSIKTVAEEV